MIEINSTSSPDDDMLVFPEGSMAPTELAHSQRLHPSYDLSPREHRIGAGVSLEAISEKTKISRRFLEAIEEGAYDRLPGGIFSTSYIRQYAAQTGYSTDLILSDYRASIEPVQSDIQSDSGSNSRVRNWWRAFQKPARV
jgi:hypothetical protein